MQYMYIAVFILGMPTQQVLLMHNIQQILASILQREFFFIDFIFYQFDNDCGQPSKNPIMCTFLK